MDDKVNTFLEEAKKIKRPITIQEIDNLKIERKIDKHWCMCTELEAVYRDRYSTCSKCKGKDAYGRSEERPKEYQKEIKTK